MKYVDVRETSGGRVVLLDKDGSPLGLATSLFSVEVDGRIADVLEIHAREAAADHIALFGTVSGTTVQATWHIQMLAGEPTFEFGLELHNTGRSSCRISRMDPLRLNVGTGWSVLSFRSSWGEECEPVIVPSVQGMHLESRSGRSSHGASPWLGLERPGNGIIVAPAWSGNWHIDLMPDGGITAGISAWNFFTDLEPGGAVTAPSVVVALGDDREAAAEALTSAVARDWIRRSVTSDRLPVEWNHWWPYEDIEVNDDIIERNACIAASVGVRVCTLDAGWFGPPDGNSDWRLQRGDWNVTNTERFPGGLGAVGESIRGAGSQPGLWLEVEAVGCAAEVRHARPELLAVAPDGFMRDKSYPGGGSVGLDPEDPTFLGYVCLGSVAGREYALESLNYRVREMGARWLKLDFNVDPDRGCGRTDHGHGAGDGLFRHYEGLYEVLDRFMADNPEVIVEACSSGGLRVDLGLARHVHCFFLSDPDYTEHHLQVAWGTSLMLPPVAMLHWSWSQCRMDLPEAKVDFGTLDVHEFDLMLRAAMIHRFGISLRLPELTSVQLERLAWHTLLFDEVLAPFVREGVLRRLTGQPLRRGGGERSPVFQISTGERHLIAAFRLSEGTPRDQICPHGLKAGRRYWARDLATGRTASMQDGRFHPDTSVGAVSSWLYIVEPAY